MCDQQLSEDARFLSERSKLCSLLRAYGKRMCIDCGFGYFLSDKIKQNRNVLKISFPPLPPKKNK